MSTLAVFFYSIFQYCTGLILNHEYMNSECCCSLFFFLLVFKSRFSFSYDAYAYMSWSLLVDSSRLLVKKHDGRWRSGKISFLAIIFFLDDRNVLRVVRADDRVAEGIDRIAESA